MAWLPVRWALPRPTMAVLAAVPFACVPLIVGFVAYAATDAVRTEIFAFPGGGYDLELRHDSFLGQVETVTVIRDPDTPRAHVVFKLVGDSPSAFAGWQDGQTAILAIRGDDAAPTRRSLRCVGEACRLDGR